MNFYQSLQSNTAVPTRLDDTVISYPIMAKDTPTNPGRLGRSTQDVAEPVILGPCKRREPLVEIASPYHVEAREENTSDTMERSSQQAAHHSLLNKHSDLETDASVASQSSTGAGVATNIMTDVHPRFASSSSASTNRERRRGGGGDDRGEGGDGTHERGREWEREHARRAD